MFEEAAIARKDSVIESSRSESFSTQSRRDSSTPQSPLVCFIEDIPNETYLLSYFLFDCRHYSIYLAIINGTESFERNVNNRNRS